MVKITSTGTILVNGVSVGGVTRYGRDRWVAMANPDHGGRTVYGLTGTTRKQVALHLIRAIGFAL